MPPASEPFFGKQQRRILCPVACHVAFKPLPCLSLFRRASHLWQRMKNTACAKSYLSFFNITVLSLWLLPWVDWLCAWGYLYVDQTHAKLNYSETLVAWVVILSDVCTAVDVLWLTGWLDCQDFRTLGTSLLLVTSQCGEGALWDLSQAVHGKHALLLLKWSSECVHHGIFFCFWYRTQQFLSKKLTRAHHCHDSSGFSLSTVVIFPTSGCISMFLNILCGVFSGLCL